MLIGKTSTITPTHGNPLAQYQDVCLSVRKFDDDVDVWVEYKHADGSKGQQVQLRDLTPETVKELIALLKQSLSS